MLEIQVLVVDDASKWQELLMRTLTSLGKNVQVRIASNYDQARNLMRTQAFHLAIVDLHLGDTALSPSDVNELGFRVIEELQRDNERMACGLLILTGYGTTERALKAFKKLGVSDFLDKASFEREAFLNSVREALFHTLLKRMQQKREQRHLLTFTFRQNALVAVQLRTPSHYQDHQLPDSARINLQSFADAVAQIHQLLTTTRHLRSGKTSTEHPKVHWREIARATGKKLYERLSQIPAFTKALGAGQGMAQPLNNLSLHFNGPRAHLQLPIELLRGEQGYLALQHPVHRQMFSEGMTWSQKVEPFHIFLEKIRKTQQPLRILLMAANTANPIPAVETEIQMIAELLTSVLYLLNVSCKIDTLTSAEATYTEVEARLKKSKYHIVHYAGHGVFQDEIPEASGLIFKDGDELRIMQADRLRTLLQNSETQFVFLSCCLGAHSASNAGHGDFLGIIDSIVQADMPAVLGYRWEVGDEVAHVFALAFYETLFTTFSFDDAIFYARQEIVLQKGLDDETWASPILVLQNP